MPSYLILKLQGVMQAYGGHTYEDYRPSLIFPTRSAVVGLLGACLGLERERPQALEALNDSFELGLSVLAHPRLVEQRHFDKELKPRAVTLHKMTDYHTVLDARRADGGKRDDAIVSRREYLCDAEFTLALSFKDKAGLDAVVKAVKKPHYTPYLGRRSCPLQRPLFEAIVDADTAEQALRHIQPEGTLYSEIELSQSYPMSVRDLPLFGNRRRFITRTVYVVGG